MKKEKLYIITRHRNDGTDLRKNEPITLPDAIEYFSTTLETGQCYQHEKGRKKINMQPKSMKALITNVNNALDNAACNGCASSHYSFEEVV